jgi:predicted PurR-regulated permease PerM
VNTNAGWSFQRIFIATLVLMSIVLGFWILYRFIYVVFILFIAIVIGTVIRPAVTWLNERGISRKLGVILVFLFLLAVLVLFALLLFPLIVDQGTTITAVVPEYYQNLRAWMFDSNNLMVVRLGNFLPPTLTAFNPAEQTDEQTLASAEQALGYIASATNTIIITTAILLLVFYWTLDGPRIIQSLLLFVPKGKRENISELISAMEIKIAFYMGGQSILCLFIGILALVAYLLIGLPNALALAFVAGIFEAIPMVGPLLGAIPAAVIALSISPTKLIWVVVATLVIQQLENNLLVPGVMRKAVGINPMVSLLAIFAFSSIFGIAGALMAIPLAAIIQILLNRFVFDQERDGQLTTTGRDHISRLRYETQNLSQGLGKQARLEKGGTDLQITQIDKVMDEIESIAVDLDELLAQLPQPDLP